MKKSKSPKALRICAGASSGGHMNQLLMLLEHSDSWPVKPAFYMTTLPLLRSKLEQRGPVYVVGESNRQHPLKSIGVFIRCFKIALKERPDVVITTGSMPLLFFCLSAKLFGSKIVWIDSIANIRHYSMSGSVARNFADLFITQWKDLASKDDKAEYIGALL